MYALRHQFSHLLSQVSSLLLSNSISSLICCLRLVVYFSLILLVLSSAVSDIQSLVLYLLDTCCVYHTHLANPMWVSPIHLCCSSSNSDNNRVMTSTKTTPIQQTAKMTAVRTMAMATVRVGQWSSLYHSNWIVLHYPLILNYMYTAIWWDLNGKLRKRQKPQQLSWSCRSCAEVISEGPRRAGKGKGPKSRRKRVCEFADVCPFTLSFTHHRKRIKNSSYCSCPLWHWHDQRAWRNVTYKFTLEKALGQLGWS